MNRIDFTQLGGFPVTQYTLDYLQQSYSPAFAALAAMIGDKVIISGCIVTGSVVADGWISVSGELIPFVGGPWTSGAQVIIQETPATRIFGDGSTPNVYFTRIATIGSPGTFAFSDLKGPSLVPSGIISMWSGAINAIPAGYALCDGTNETPNLSGMFIVGYSATDTDYNAIGKIGGEKMHLLSVPEMPPHTHTQTGINAANSGTSGIGANNGTSETGSTGGGDPHENRPPYFTLAYIIKL